MVDIVLLSMHSDTLDGLSQMLEAAIGPHDYVHRYVPVEIALLIIEAAKRAPDRPEWFPRGRWATIQELVVSTEAELKRMFEEPPQ